MKEADAFKIGLLAQFVVVLVLLAAVMVGQQRPPAPAPPPDNNSVVFSGPNSAITTVRYHRVGDQETLDALWYEHLGVERKISGWPVTVDRSPQVDFQTHELVAIFDGPAGNISGLLCRAIDDNTTRRRLRFDWSGYQSIGHGNDTTAWGMIVLPKSPLPIVIEEDVQAFIGRPPIWRQQAVLDPLSE